MTIERFSELERETRALLAAVSQALVQQIGINRRLCRMSSECVAKSRDAIAQANLSGSHAMCIPDPPNWDS